MELTHVTILEKRAELDRLERLKKIQRDFGMLTYKPHYKQDEFHRAGKIKRRYLRTGNRFGKSDCGAAEDCAWALGYRAWYMKKFDVVDGKGVLRRQHDPIRDKDMIYDGLPKRAVKILIVVADWDKAEEIFTNQVEGDRQGKLFKFLPKSEILNVYKNQSGNISEIHVRSIHEGTSIIMLDTIKSFKSNKMGQESGDFDAIHIDEPCPEDMWKANARGLMDRDGSAWFTCTPLAEQWINDMFLPAGNIRDEFKEAHVATKKVDEFELQFWMLTGSTYDNPYMSARAIAGFKSDLTSEDMETRIDGRPAAYTGCVYKEFRRETHIYTDVPVGWVDWFTPPVNYTIRLAIDTHPSTPHAVLFCATAPSGHKIFYNEIFEKLYVSELVARVWEYLKGAWPTRVHLEQAAYNETPFDGDRIADEFIKTGMPVEPAVKDLAYGILKVKDELSKLDASGKPFMRFSPLLYETPREFDRYCWNPKTGKPYDKDDHMMENLYRLVLGGLDYVEPQDFSMVQVKEFNVNRIALTLPANASHILSDLNLSGKNIGNPAYKRDRYRRGNSHSFN